MLCEHGIKCVYFFNWCNNFFFDNLRKQPTSILDVAISTEHKYWSPTVVLSKKLLIILYPVVWWTLPKLDVGVGTVSKYDTKSNINGVKPISYLQQTPYHTHTRADTNFLQFSCSNKIKVYAELKLWSGISISNNVSYNAIL